MNANAMSAASSALPPLFGTGLAARTMIDYLIYAGAIVLVTVIVTLWIATMRQPLKLSHRKKRHHSSRGGISTWFKGSDDEGSSGKKGRRRRRAHRRRNPTLAETGGLPPLRNAPPSSEENQPH
jgi:hypothetical protein